MSMVVHPLAAPASRAMRRLDPCGNRRSRALDAITAALAAGAAAGLTEVAYLAGVVSTDEGLV